MEFVSFNLIIYFLNQLRNLSITFSTFSVDISESLAVRIMAAISAGVVIV